MSTEDREEANKTANSKTWRSLGSLRLFSAQWKDHLFTFCVIFSSMMRRSVLSFYLAIRLWHSAFWTRIAAILCRIFTCNYKYYIVFPSKEITINNFAQYDNYSTASFNIVSCCPWPQVTFKTASLCYIRICHLSFWQQ